METSNNQTSIQPTIHTFPFQQPHNSQFKMNQETLKIGNSSQSSKPHLIIVPHEDQSGHHQELIQEVFRYPPGTIETVVEKNFALLSNSNPSNSYGKSETSKKKTRSQKKNKLHTSQTSIASSNSAVSNMSLSSMPSQTDSTLSDTSSNSTINTGDLVGQDLGHSSSRSPFIHRLHEGDISDSSSNISTMSDLSGYEDEYTTIKRLISDSSHKKLTKQHLSLNESLRKKTFMETKILEQESAIKSLHGYKEELEIQVHRLSVQLQNAVREKDVCQEQLEITQTKLTEKNQHEYFEVLKEKVNLEGQYETLKQEFEHSSLHITQLSEKLQDCKNELEHFKKNCVKFSETENEFKNKISSLEKQNLKLENKLKAMNDTLTVEVNKSLNLKTELSDCENTLKEMRIKIDSHAQESENYQEAIHNLKKWNLEYSEREEQERNERRKTESLLSKSLQKYNTLKENSEWYQTQLSKAQKLQSDLQNELTEAKSSLTMVSSEKDRLKREVERLSSEIENNRVKAVRDKSLLLLQLEELEADMREREAVIRRLEDGDKVNHVKLSEERFKKLEEDHKKLQQIKIEMRDVLRHNDSLKEELSHQSSILRKQEDSIHDLRKGSAMLQEELGSKKVCIASLTEKLNEAKTKIEKVLATAKEKDETISQLKEQKAKLEATVLTAEEDKQQVDKTITKLKEDMTKLSSNFFKMKHDLSAKDKQIEFLSNQISQLSHSEKELLSKTQLLSAQLKQEQEAKSHTKEISVLRESLKELSDKNAKTLEELSQQRKSIESLEVEKKSLVNSINLRDERIENMQGVIDKYKEKILQKDEEIFTRKGHLSKLENTHYDLQKKYNLLNNDYQMSLQEKEQFLELENNYKTCIAELKESVKLERRSRENYDRKYEEYCSELAKTKEQLKIKNELCEDFEKLKAKVDKQEEQLKMNQEKVRKLNMELEIQNKCVTDRDNKIKSLEEKFKESSRMESTYKESLEAKDHKVLELQASLSSELSEIQKLNQVISEIGEKQQTNESYKKFVTSVRNHSSHSDRAANRLISKRPLKTNSSSKLCKDDRRELDVIKRKFKDSLTQMSQKNQEISALNAKVLEYENLKSLHNSLMLQMEQTKQSLEIQGREKEILSGQCHSLEESLQRTRSNLLLKEEECSNWKTKYELLVDTIPQRDTNTQVINTNPQWKAAEENEKMQLNLENSEGVSPTKLLVQDFSLDDRVKFTQTMSYLQKQISFTAEALQSKDAQIMELNRKLSCLTSKPTCPSQISNASSQTVPDNSNEILNGSGDRLFTKETCAYNATSVVSQESSSPEGKLKEQTVESVSQELATKEADFKAKQRRYESNLRLLTRKLKEHMKGRRIAEKELELCVQGNEKMLETKGIRYQTLKNRYLELEKKCQNLESEIVSRDALVKEKELAGKNLEKSLDEERKSVLRMQKEVGQIEEMKHCGEMLKEELITLRSELTQKKKLLMEADEKLQTCLKEKQAMEMKGRTLTSQVDHLTQRLQEEMTKNSEREKLFVLTQEEVAKRDGDISDLKENLNSYHLKCSHLEESLHRVQAEDASNAKRIARLNEDNEGLKSCIEMKNTLTEDLNARKTILEKEIQIKSEAIELLKEEKETLLKRLAENEEKNESSQTDFNQKMLEAKQIETSLNDTLTALHKEKLAYQSQCTQLKIALNSALERFQAFSTLPNLPSPPPLNTTSLTKLMEQCSKPPPTTNCFRNSLNERLSSLREELSVLHSEIKSREVSQS